VNLYRILMLLTAAGVVMLARTPAAMESSSSFQQGSRQEQSLDSVIERAMVFVESFERDFAAVVAEEQLEQRASNMSSTGIFGPGHRQTHAIGSPPRPDAGS
jgi:hypothetical protein